jgi:ribonucleotide reductase beta subunit family protein with ferritin-like domain
MATSFSPSNTVAKSRMEPSNSISQTTQTTATKSRSKTPAASPTFRPTRKGSAGSVSEAAAAAAIPPALALDGVALPAELRTEATPIRLPEPLLDENDDRFVIFPIKHHDVWAMYKKHMSVHWVPEEIDLSKDMSHWEKLNDNERHFIKHILGFFAGSDGIVMENLATRFSRDVQWPEARFFYACQNLLEAVHCVAPETKIMTDSGYYMISDLENKKVNVWNGEEFTEVTVVNTSPSAKLIKVVLSNGMYLECTEEHKWFTRSGPVEHPEQCKIIQTFTKDLKVGDIIGKYSLPIIDPRDPDEFLNPYTHGFFCGDGSYTNKYPQIALYGEKQALLPYLEVSSINPVPEYKRTVCYITNKINKDKFFVPINYSQKTKLLWLAGLLDADGCVNVSNKGLTSIQLGSIHTEFLNDVQLLLSTLGIRANVTKSKDAEKRFMPDGKGGMKEYNCATIYCLYISLANVHKLVTLGFTPRRLKIVTKEVKENAILLRVKEIIDSGRISPTFCFTEPKKHAGIFNGILTGQSETYSLLIDTYITDPKEKSDILRAISTIPAVEKKAKWAMEWIDSKDADFATRLLGFAAVEGIFFSGAFCAIFWLKQRGIMPGLTLSNEFIARDEGLHTEFACLLYSKIMNRLPKKTAHKILRDAVKIEKHFITKALPCELIGMNAELMKQYIEFVADRLSLQLGYPKIYGAANPFDFMERISLENKDNFFEKRVSTYAKAGVGKNKDDMKFAMDAAF